MRNTMRLETERLIIQDLSEDETVALLGVYEQCADYLSLQTPEPPSLAMIQSDWAATAENGGIFAGIFRRDGDQSIGDQPLGVISFVPQSFRGQRDYAFISLLMIQSPDRRRGFG